jgi:hypothetical protein
MVRLAAGNLDVHLVTGTEGEGVGEGAVLEVVVPRHDAEQSGERVVDTTSVSTWVISASEKSTSASALFPGTSPSVVTVAVFVRLLAFGRSAS